MPSRALLSACVESGPFFAWLSLLPDQRTHVVESTVGGRRRRNLARPRHTRRIFPRVFKRAVGANQEQAQRAFVSTVTSVERPLSAGVSLALCAWRARRGYLGLGGQLAFAIEFEGAQNARLGRVTSPPRVRIVHSSRPTS
jgi:hypothetical protein